MKYTIGILLALLINTLLLPQATFAQSDNIWTLEKCILHAKDNNLQLRQSRIAIDQADIDLRQARDARYPNVSLSSNTGANLGRSVDPTSYSFVTQAIFTNGFNLSANVPIYTGNQIKNNIQQSQIDQQAAAKDADRFFNDLALNVANAYLQVLLAYEQTNIAQQQLQTSQQQLDQTNKLIAAGTLAAANRYDLEALIARDEQNLLTAQNTIGIAYLALKNLLSLDPADTIQVQTPDSKTFNTDIDLAQYTLDQMYTTSLTTQPQIAAASLREQSALLNIDLAQAAKKPRVTGFAQFGTNYSSIAPDTENPDLTNLVIDSTQTPVRINEFPAILTEYTATGISFPTKGYFKQITQNFNSTVGVSVQVPIYNNGIAQRNIERAKLGVLNAQLQAEQTRQQLKTDIQRALTNAQNAQLQLKATQKTLKTTQIAYDNAQKRYRLGTANSYELNATKNNLYIAEINELTAKYDFLFKLKVLDFYLGRTITLQ